MPFYRLCTGIATYFHHCPFPFVCFFMPLTAPLGTPLTLLETVIIHFRFADLDADVVEVLLKATGGSPTPPARGGG